MIGSDCSSTFLGASESGIQNAIRHRYLPNPRGEDSGLPPRGWAASSDLRHLDGNRAADSMVYFQIHHSLTGQLAGMAAHLPKVFSQTLEKTPPSSGPPLIKYEDWPSVVQPYVHARTPKELA